MEWMVVSQDAGHIKLDRPHTTTVGVETLAVAVGLRFGLFNASDIEHRISGISSRLDVRQYNQLHWNLSENSR